MKRLLLTSVLLITNFFLNAQEKKWSVEANYPLNISGDNLNFGEMDGVIDLGIKYRFVKLGPINLGAGVNMAFFKNYSNFTYGTQNNNAAESDYRAKSFLVQPKIVAELPIPGASKLRPQVAIGYTIVVDDTYYKNDGNVEFDATGADGALNLNLGLSYDISSRFFVQIQYDYLNIARKGQTTLVGQPYSFDFKEGASILKAGLGFRF